EFAEKVGIARASASYYENSDNKALPNIDILCRMSRVLEISPESLMGYYDFDGEIKEFSNRTGLTSGAIKCLMNLEQHHIRSLKKGERYTDITLIISKLIENNHFTEICRQICTYVDKQQIERIVQSEFDNDNSLISHFWFPTGISFSDNKYTMVLKTLEDNIAESFRSLMYNLRKISRDNQWAELKEERSIRYRKILEQRAARQDQFNKASAPNGNDKKEE
ncbi:MAG: helix-turn-helix transcriptional regulator, partial [Clostridiales bacterium]